MKNSRQKFHSSLPNYVDVYGKTKQNGMMYIDTENDDHFFLFRRCSKAALNQLVKCFSLIQDPQNLVYHLSVHPGHVQTDMGGSRGRKAPLQVEEVAPKIAHLVDYLNQDTNGQFVDFEAKILPY